MSNYNCIVVLGPTASGKTNLACRLAYELNGEIISADSRQVYKELDVGTGKDLDEYTVNQKQIPYHLMDIREPGEQFFLHEFTGLCDKAFEGIISRNNLPIICGGTGLYLDTLRKDFSFTQIKEDTLLREQLKNLSKEELLEYLDQYPEEYTHHADINSQKRIIRAIEVAKFQSENPGKIKASQRPYHPFYIGMDVPLDERKKLISERLVKRIENGLIEEGKRLIEEGLTFERLEFLGLEYKFISFYLQNKISKEELVEQLQTAIYQFAKRQMTWFRKMEKEGVNIKWVKKNIAIETLLEQIRNETEFKLF